MTIKTKLLYWALIYACFGLWACDMESIRRGIVADKAPACAEQCSKIKGSDRWTVDSARGVCSCSGPVSAAPALITAEGYCRVCGKMHTKDYP